MFQTLFLRVWLANTFSVVKSRTLFGKVQIELGLMFLHIMCSKVLAKFDCHVSIATKINCKPFGFSHILSPWHAIRCNMHGIPIRNCACSSTTSWTILFSALAICTRLHSWSFFFNNCTVLKREQYLFYKMCASIWLRCSRFSGMRII